MQRLEKEFELVDTGESLEKPADSMSRAAKQWLRITRIIGALDKIRKTFWAYDRICNRFREIPKIGYSRIGTYSDA